MLSHWPEKARGGRPERGRGVTVDSGLASDSSKGAVPRGCHSAELFTSESPRRRPESQFTAEGHGSPVGTMAVLRNRVAIPQCERRFPSSAALLLGRPHSDKLKPVSANGFSCFSCACDCCPLPFFCWVRMSPSVIFWDTTGSVDAQTVQASISNSSDWDLNKRFITS